MQPLRQVRPVGQSQAEDPSSHLFIAALRHLGRHDLTFTQLAAMVYLLRFPSSSVGDVAAALGRSLAATGRLANDLVKAGLVARSEHAQDRRVKQLRLTAAGRRFVERLHRHRVAALHLDPALANALSEKERDVVHEALAILARHGRV